MTHKFPAKFCSPVDAVTVGEGTYTSTVRTSAVMVVNKEWISAPERVWVSSVETKRKCPSVREVALMMWQNDQFAFLDRGDPGGRKSVSS